MEIKINLKERDIPRKWYNLAADLPTPMLPPLGPDGKPVTPDMLAPVFPMNLIEQEVSTKRWIPIPEEILDMGIAVHPPILAKFFQGFGNQMGLGASTRFSFKVAIETPGSHDKPAHFFLQYAHRFRNRQSQTVKSRQVP